MQKYGNINCLPKNVHIFFGCTPFSSSCLHSFSDQCIFSASTTTSMKNLNKSFFFRSHTLWNSLPFDIRNSMILSLFNLTLTDNE